MTLALLLATVEDVDTLHAHSSLIVFYEFTLKLNLIMLHRVAPLEFLRLDTLLLVVKHLCLEMSPIVLECLGLLA